MSLDAHAAGDVYAEADGRIDVAARNRADAVGHRDDGEAEGGGDAQQIDRGGGRAAPMPPITAAPQPKNTNANVPMNSARALFILRSPL